MRSRPVDVLWWAWGAAALGVCHPAWTHLCVTFAFRVLCPSSDCSIRVWNLAVEGVTTSNVVFFTLGVGVAVVLLLVFLAGRLGAGNPWQTLLSAGLLAVVLIVTLYMAFAELLVRGAVTMEALPYVTFPSAGLLVIGASVVGVSSSIKVRETAPVRTRATPATPAPRSRRSPR